MTIIQNISLISFQLKYLYHGFQRPLEKWTNGFREASSCFYTSNQKTISRFWDILWLVKSWQVIPIFTTQCFGSNSNDCEKLRPMVIRSKSRLQPGTSGSQVSFICTWPALANSPFLFVSIISCTALPINILICNILRSRAIQHAVNFCSKHWTFILLLLRLPHSRKGYPKISCYQ